MTKSVRAHIIGNGMASSIGRGIHIPKTMENVAIMHSLTIFCNRSYKGVKHGVKGVCCKTYRKLPPTALKIA